MFVAVLDYDKSQELCKVGVFTDSFSAISLTTVPLRTLGNFALSNNYTPINFSIDRFGGVVQDCGKFDRFLGHKEVYIIVAEIVSKSGVVQGYRIASSKSNNVVNIKKSQLLEYVKSPDVIIQNAIVRGGAIHCYPLKPFNKMVYSPVPQSKVLKESNIGTTPTSKQTKPVRQSKSRVKDIIAQMDDAQKAEVENCVKKGINPALIANKDLSPQQMRVLWVAKANGVFSEAFNKPEYSVDVMKFYADKLIDKDLVAECKPMLDNPNLSLRQLDSLYNCVLHSVPYSDLCDGTKTDSEIYLTMLYRDKNMWEGSMPSNNYVDEELLDKVSVSIMKLKEIY